MIEPPGDFRRAGVFEIYYGVLIAIELLLIKERAGAVQEARVDEVYIAADALPEETGEEGGGAGAVETFVVVEDSHSQISLPFPLFSFLQCHGTLALTPVADNLKT